MVAVRERPEILFLDELNADGLVLSAGSIAADNHSIEVQEERKTKKTAHSMLPVAIGMAVADVFAITWIISE